MYDRTTNACWFRFAAPKLLPFVPHSSNFSMHQPLYKIARHFLIICGLNNNSKEFAVRLKNLFLIAVLFLASVMLINCEDSQVASRNISRAAHQFEIFRRVVFYNGITGEYILQIEGYCSVVHESSGKLSVVIKAEDGSFLKHYLGLSDNVTYFAEQLHPSKVSTQRYRVIFKPSVIIPAIDFE